MDTKKKKSKKPKGVYTGMPMWSLFGVHVHPKRIAHLSNVYVEPHFRHSKPAMHALDHTRKQAIPNDVEYDNAQLRELILCGFLKQFHAKHPFNNNDN